MRPATKSITLRSRKTSRSYTYDLYDAGSQAWFVWCGTSYMGMIRGGGSFRRTKASPRGGAPAEAANAFAWYWARRNTPDVLATQCIVTVTSAPFARFFDEAMAGADYGQVEH